MYLSVDQALNVDVLPNKETAGKDLGFMNIATCAGQAIGVAITSTLVSVLGSYTVVFPVAIGMTAIAAITRALNNEPERTAYRRAGKNLPTLRYLHMFGSTQRARPQTYETRQQW